MVPILPIVLPILPYMLLEYYLAYFLLAQCACLCCVNFPTLSLHCAHSCKCLFVVSSNFDNKEQVVSGFCLIEFVHFKMVVIIKKEFANYANHI